MIERMFESAQSVAAPAVGGTTLDAGALLAWQRELSAALEAPSGLDDAARVDAIRALEQLGCVVSAAQAHLAAELDVSQRGKQEAAGIPSARGGRGVAAQVAWARRESPHRGQRHLGPARVLPAELPHTWGAWRAGRVTEWKATRIARETACLSREDRREVDALLAADPTRLEDLGEVELVSAVQSVAYRLDPASFVSGRRRAEADRHVTLRPAPDTMTWLTALLPVKDGVAAYAALTLAADSARAGGDPRGKGQVMADTLVGGILAARAHGGPAVPVALDLVMTEHDLFGTGEDPATPRRVRPHPRRARTRAGGGCLHPRRARVAAPALCPPGHRRAGGR